MKKKTSKASSSKRKLSTKTKVTITMDEELYIQIRSLSIMERRTTSQQVLALIDIALQVLASSGAEQEEEPTQELIGFKLEKPEEDIEDLEEPEEEE